MNKVSNTLRSIKEQINSDSITFRGDLEIINLILNLDILTKILEDLEEQIIFSNSNRLNKNILSSTEKEYILKFLENQQINFKFEDEMYKFVQSIVSLQNNHIIIIIKLPILEREENRLMQLEPVNTNGSRIDTNIRYVANYQQTFYEQKEKCFVCDNSYPVNDECIVNILKNQKAKCSMYKQPDQPIIKEISTGTILINTHKAVHVQDSCGDSRILLAPTIIETGNCTVIVQNLTFKSYPRTMELHEYLTPIFGKEIVVIKQKTDIEEIHQVNLKNLEEITNIKLRITSSQTIGGIVITSTILITLIIFCIHRFKYQANRKETHTVETEDIVTLRITDDSPKNLLDNNHIEIDIPKDGPPRLTKSLFPTPKFLLTSGPNKPIEDA